MVKEDRYEQEYLPYRESKRTDTDRNNLRRSPCHRLGQLSNMKADRRRSVEIEIDVVRRVKPPEPRNLVSQNVPEIERIVEQQHGRGGFKPKR